VTPAEVRELAEATYGTLPVSPGVARAARPALAAPDSPFRCNVALSGPQRTVLHRKYLVPSYATAQPGEAEALEIVAQILGRRSGILRSLLVEEGLATRAGATFRGQDLDAGVLDIGIGAASENLGAVEEALDRAVETIRDGTLAQEKIELAKEALITGCLGERLSARRQAALYGAGIAVGRTVRQIEGYTAAVAKVTAEDVRLAATKYLDPRRAVTGYLRCAPAAE
jgi:zinc protease